MQVEKPRDTSMPLRMQPKIPKIFFTEIGSAVPKGFRESYLNEIALAYRECGEEFRKELEKMGSVRINQLGLDGAGPRCIDEVGNFRKISEKRFKETPVNERARLYPGNYRARLPVVVNFANYAPHPIDGDIRRLNVRVTHRSDGPYRIAYVALGEGELAPETSDSKLTSLVRGNPPAEAIEQREPSIKGAVVFVTDLARKMLRLAEDLGITVRGVREPKE